MGEWTGRVAGREDGVYVSHFQMFSYIFTFGIDARNPYRLRGNNRHKNIIGCSKRAPAPLSCCTLR